MVSLSIGFIVHKFITSKETPYWASCSAAYRHTPTIREYETTVQSVPSLITFAFPKGIKYSGSWKSFSTSKETEYINSFSRKQTGLLFLIEDFNNPLQSYAS